MSHNVQRMPKWLLKFENGPTFWKRKNFENMEILPDMKMRPMFQFVKHAHGNKCYYLQNMQNLQKIIGISLSLHYGFPIAPG